MIKINLKNVASCQENPVTLETDKKVNLVYGLNGTGKTTLSDFLYFRNTESRFNDCTLEGITDEKILVYNQSFIQENFHDTDQMKGIFTLSRENKEAEGAIKIAAQEKQQLENEKAAKQQEKTKLKTENSDNTEDAKDTIWQVKTEYTGGDRILAFCLEGLQTKKLLFNHINQIPRPESKPNTTIENLKSEAQSVIGEGAQRYEPLSQIDINVESIEQDAIFSEVIVGKEDSPVAGLIQKLNNSDWVKQGLGYLPDRIDETEQCPFCQQETITQQIVRDVKAYFDETYEGKISKIKHLEEKYRATSLPNIESYKNHPLMQENKDQFENFYTQLQFLFNKNYLQIEAKLKEPSQKVELDSTEDKLKKLNDLIDAANQKIQSHNHKLDNKEETKRTIKNTFWQIIRWEYDDKFIGYHKENEKIKVEITRIESDIEGINQKIEQQEDEILRQQKNMINIDEAVQNINARLKELGIEGFSVIKYGENSYRIAREGQSEKQFSTLSEGEKMIISFLYFMELCKGKESEDEIETDKIVVIDDPVSSLSHTYVFNLSQWVKRHFFDDGHKKIFVLTHNLYFFHELIKIEKNNRKDRKLFRLTKSSSAGTQIQPMEEDEIKNEYESYWQVIKDHNDGKASDASLANSMRNILEHFFGFIEKDQLSNILQNLGENQEFIPFHRYINRESHSDSINITDSKEIDPELFKKAFRDVFIKSEYEGHYTKMMGEKNNTPD